MYGLQNPNICLLVGDSVACEMFITRNKLTGRSILMAKCGHQNMKALCSVDLCCTFSTVFCRSVLYFQHCVL